MTTTADIALNFVVPSYEYQIHKISVTLELFRYTEMHTGVSYLFGEINNLIKLKKLIKMPIQKLWVYVSQMFMTILTERSFTNDSVVKLDDGLFNESKTQIAINDFYRDLNYATRSKHFKPDMFDITKWINDVINMLKSLHSVIDETIEPFNVIMNDDDVDVVTFKIDRKLVQKSITTDEFRANRYIMSQLLVNNDIPLEFTINRDLYNRVQPRYLSDNGFNNLLLCCLIRYETLGSGANQFVVDLRYKDQLSQLGMNFECFASVFNCHYANYCSMFFDIERYFGSSGSFMALNIKSGMYMANPPYSEYLLSRMYDKVKTALSNNDNDVCFIMSIPEWKKFPLETRINKENLYQLRVVKHDKFHNSMDHWKLITIPKYISYVLMNSGFQEHYTKLQEFKQTILAFKNL